MLLAGDVEKKASLYKQIRAALETERARAAALAQVEHGTCKTVMARIWHT